MIPSYKKILYATDLSDNAAHAFRHAIAVARTQGGRITLLHVLPEIEPAVLNYVSTVMGEDKLSDFEHSHAEEVRDQIRKKLHAFAKQELLDHPEDIDLLDEIEIHHGSAVARILEVSDNIDADLIVLGSHGKGRLKYAFLGSVAEKVLRKTGRPVLIAPIAH